MDISVIIPVLADRRIIRTLQALSRQTLSRDAYEVIVIENGSHELESVVLEHGAAYQHLPLASIPAARNEGLRHARAELVAFTDADCVPDPSWLAALANALKSTPGLVGVGGRIERYRPLTPVQLYASNLVNDQRELNYLPILDLPYVVTANCAFRTRAVLDAGAFDANLASGSDVDLCYALGLRGGKIGIVADAVVLHDNRGRVSGHVQRFFRYAVFQVALFRKYRRVAARRAILSSYPFSCLRRGATTLISACRLARADRCAASWTGSLLILEGLALLLGHVTGSLRFRTLYL